MKLNDKKMRILCIILLIFIYSLLAYFIIESLIGG
jgi:hypothetical protein